MPAGLHSCLPIYLVLHVLKNQGQEALRKQKGEVDTIDSEVIGQDELARNVDGEICPDEDVAELLLKTKSFEEGGDVVLPHVRQQNENEDEQVVLAFGQDDGVGCKKLKDLDAKCIGEGAR